MPILRAGIEGTMMQTYIFVDDGGNVVGEYSTNDVGNARAECARRTDAEKKNLAVYRWVSKYIYVAPDTERIQLL